jgi:tetratricopeptide (TPR) repeat protein
VSPERASEVARRLAALVEAHPDNALGRYHYAMSLWKGSPAAHAEVDLAEVQRQLERAVALDPDLALAHLKLGVLLSEKGRLEDAARELREAIRSKPDLADAHYRLGHLYLKMGRKAEAEKQLEEFRRLSER